MKIYPSINANSIATKPAAPDNRNEFVTNSYRPTEGNFIETVQQELKQVRECLLWNAEVSGIVTTSSAHYLARVFVDTDLVKNEIICQAMSAQYYIPEVLTMVETGGQNSKPIIRDSVTADFAMNIIRTTDTGNFRTRWGDHHNFRGETKLKGSRCA